MHIDFPPESYRIETPRLVIRSPVAADIPAMMELMSNPANLPMGETKAETGLTAEGMGTRLDKWRRLASEGRNAFLVVALRNDDDAVVVIGYLGFNCFRTRGEFDGSEPERDDPTPGLDGRYLTDLGVVLDHRQRRRGYSSEAVCAAAEFAYAELGCQVVRMETGLANEPWRGLMRSLGLAALEEKGQASYPGKPIAWLYKVHRAAWEAAKVELKEKGKWPLE
jgi:RimJ/RimL family protein N-acetyltransferase